MHVPGHYSLNLPKIRQLEGQLDDLLLKEETLWRQRSRVEWLKFGDQNTRFFHEGAKTQTRTNVIHSVLDDQNVWQTDPEVIGALFCDHFSGLFTSSGGHCMDRILRFIDPCISDVMNSKLMHPFT